MPLVNLINEQRLVARQRERQARGFLMVFVGAIGLSVLAFGTLWVETGNQQAEAMRLQARINELQPLLKEIEAVKREESSIQPRLTTLEDAQESTARWRRTLDHLSRHTPDPIWLTNLRASRTDNSKPINLSIVGISASQESVAQFITLLQGSADLENIQLRYTQEKQAEGALMIEFEINADVKGTAEAAPVQEGKGGANEAA